MWLEKLIKAAKDVQDLLQLIIFSSLLSKVIGQKNVCSQLC